MSFLTQVLIDSDTARRLRLWRWNSYDWHQAVWRVFPHRDGKPREFLTRLDERHGGYRLLLVSPVEPTRPDWCPAECWQTKVIPESYFGKDRYAFQLCANPTKKVAKERPDGSLTKNGRRVPLRTREELVDWIRRKGEQGGFVVDEDSLKTFSRGRDYFEKGGKRGLHSAVEYQGLMTVTDAARFHDTFTRGIGSAKAFGFGLLVIAPAFSAA